MRGSSLNSRFENRGYDVVRAYRHLNVVATNLHCPKIKIRDYDLRRLGCAPKVRDLRSDGTEFANEGKKGKMPLGMRYILTPHFNVGVERHLPKQNAVGMVHSNQVQSRWQSLRRSIRVSTWPAGGMCGFLVANWNDYM